MTKRITSGAFEFLNKVLGLSGEGAQTTELDDANVSQVFDISRLAQSGLVIGRSQGMFSSLLRTQHAAAGSIAEIMDPYNPGLTVGEFGTINFDDFGLWYIGSSARQVSSTQTIAEVEMSLDPRSGDFQGIGEIVGASEEMPLARWDNVLTSAGAGDMLENALTGHCYQPHPFPFLWPRGADLTFRSNVAGAGATVLHGSTFWAICRRGSKPSAL